MKSVMCLLAVVLGLGLLILAPGWFASEWSEWDSLSVAAKVDTYTPARKIHGVRAGMETISEEPATVRVRLPDGSLWEAEATSGCIVGGDAVAHIRMRVRVPKVLSVSWVSCGETMEPRR